MVRQQFADKLRRGVHALKCERKFMVGKTMDRRVDGRQHGVGKAAEEGAEYSVQNHDEDGEDDDSLGLQKMKEFVKLQKTRVLNLWSRCFA